MKNEGIDNGKSVGGNIKYIWSYSQRPFCKHPRREHLIGQSKDHKETNKITNSVTFSWAGNLHVSVLFIQSTSLGGDAKSKLLPTKRKLVIF